MKRERERKKLFVPERKSKRSCRRSKKKDGHEERKQGTNEPKIEAKAMKEGGKVLKKEKDRDEETGDDSQKGK